MQSLLSLHLIRQIVLLFLLCCLSAVCYAQSINTSPSISVRVKVFLEGSLTNSIGIDEAFVDVCDRTPQVRDEITREAGKSNCKDVTKADLASIINLDLHDSKISSLLSGDFSGLSRLDVGFEL